MHERRGSSRAPRADVVRSEQSARRQEQPDTPRRVGSSSSGGNESRAADAGDHSAATDRAATAGVGAACAGRAAVHSALQWSGGAQSAACVALRWALGISTSRLQVPGMRVES